MWAPTTPGKPVPTATDGQRSLKLPGIVKSLGTLSARSLTRYHEVSLIDNEFQGIQARPVSRNRATNPEYLRVGETIAFSTTSAPPTIVTPDRDRVTAV